MTGALAPFSYLVLYIFNLLLISSDKQAIIVLETSHCKKVELPVWLRRTIFSWYARRFVCRMDEAVKEVKMSLFPLICVFSNSHYFF